MKIILGPNFVLNEDESVLVVAKESDINKVFTKE